LARALRTRTKIIASTLGVAALGAALLAPSASASVSDGKFLVHAWNTETPKIEAYAGIKGVGSASPGGVVTPPAVTLANYNCGPLSFKITDAMVKFAQDNQDLQVAGKASEIKSNSEGWQGLFNFSSTVSPNVQPGFPTDGSKPNQVYLTSTMAVPDRTSAVPAGVVAYAKSYDTNCTFVDSRPTPRAGDTYSYTFSKGTGSGGRDAFSEGRYEQIDGSLASTKVELQNSGWSVNRYQSPTTLKPALSDNFPSTLAVNSDGSRQGAMTFKNTVDGYNYATFTSRADGSGTLSYAKWNGTMGTYGMTGIGAPSRANGPTAIAWDSSGNITSLSSPGNTITAPFTAAHYNEITGQNWDGSYQKPSDLKLDTPFQPVGRL